MSSQLGTVEVTCDAPAYEVVGACKAFGFSTPLDVRWIRTSHLVNSRPPRRSLFSLCWWLELLGWSKPVGRTCSCSAPLPKLRWHRFAYPPEGESDYVLGQCYGCLTIYWDEA